MIRTGAFSVVSRNVNTQKHLRAMFVIWNKKLMSKQRLVDLGAQSFAESASVLTRLHSSTSTERPKSFIAPAGEAGLRSHMRLL